MNPLFYHCSGKNRLQSPVFIVGCPRSGTTLLQNILASHSLIYSLPETDCFSIMDELCVDPSDPLDANLFKRIVCKFEEKNSIKLSDEYKQIVLLKINRNEITVKGFFEDLISSYNPRKGDSSLRVVEKTPRHYLFFDRINKIYPDAKFISIVRNPSDTISSIMDTPFGENAKSYSLARLWNYSAKHILQFKNKFPDKLYLVKYEDLCKYPIKNIEEICSFLQVSCEADMLSNFSKTAESTVAESESWKSNVFAGRIIRNDQRWRKNLDDSEVFLIDIITRKYRAKFGYPRHIPASITIMSPKILFLMGDMVRYYSSKMVRKYG